MLLIVLDDLVGFGAGARIDASAGHDLHQVDDLVPPGLIEAELQYVTLRVTGGAVVGEDPLDASVIWRGFRQRRSQRFARQLADPLLGIRNRLQHDIVVPRSAEID